MNAIQIELVSKECVGCGKIFKALKDSKQKYHSSQCESGGSLSVPRRQWNDEKPKRENVIAASVRIPLSKNESRIEEESLIYRQRLEREHASEVAKTMNAIRRDTMQDVLRELKQTEPTRIPSTENTMPRTENDSRPLPMLASESTTQPSDSTRPLEIMPPDELPAMNLIDECGRLLLSQMKGLTHGESEPSTEYKRFDPERVQVACVCAREIRELMRVKLDVIKLQRGKE